MARRIYPNGEPLPDFEKADQYNKREIRAHKGGRNSTYPRARCTLQERKDFLALQEKYDISASDLIAFMVRNMDKLLPKRERAQPSHADYEYARSLEEQNR